MLPWRRWAVRAVSSAPAIEEPLLRGTVTAWNRQGEGIVKTEHGPIAVKGVVEGEEVLVKQLSLPNTGGVVEVLRPSSDRVDAECVHHAQCSKCPWMIMALPCQRSLKAKRVASLLPPRTEILPLVESPPTSYRSTMHITLSNDGAVGYREWGGRKIVGIRECPITTQPSMVSQLLATLRKWWGAVYEEPVYQNNHVRITGLLVRISSTVPGDMALTLCVKSGIPRGLPGPHLNKLNSEIKSAFGGRASLEVVQYSRSLAKNKKFQPVVRILGDGTVRERVRRLHKHSEEEWEIDFHLRVQSTFGGNLHTKTALLNDLADWLEEPLTESAMVVDGYCGDGAIGIFLAKAYPNIRVLGVDSSETAVNDATFNARRLGLEEQYLAVSEPMHGVSGYRHLRQQVDVMVLDPPPAETPEVEVIRTIQPRYIAFHSTNVHALPRVIESLVSEGYVVVKARAYDEEPHTTSVNTLCLFKREKRASGVGTSAG